MEYSEVLYELYKVILDRKANPKEGSYTNYLMDKGIDKILKKDGDEATETIYEICDFMYHLSVLMEEMGITWDEVFLELAKRELKESNLKVFNTKGEI